MKRILVALMALGALGCRQAATADARDHGFDGAACAEAAIRGGSNDERAASSFGQACRRSDARACSLLATLSDAHESEGDSAVRSWLLYRRSCDLGYARACANLAALYERLPGYEEQAAALHADTCARGVPQACDALAAIHERRDGVSTEAWRLSLSACLQGVARGCMRLGRYHEGRDEIDAASRWYRQGCFHGDLGGCHALDRLFRATPPRRATRSAAPRPPR